MNNLSKMDFILFCFQLPQQTGYPETYQYQTNYCQKISGDCQRQQEEFVDYPPPPRAFQQYHHHHITNCSLHSDGGPPVAACASGTFPKLKARNHSRALNYAPGTVHYISDFESWVPEENAAVPVTPALSLRRQGTPCPQDTTCAVEEARKEMKAKHWLMIGIILCIGAGVVLTVGIPLAYKKYDEQVEKKIRRLLNEVPLIDGSNGVAWNIQSFHWYKLSAFNFSSDLRKLKPWNKSDFSHTDLLRLKEGQVGAQFWAAYAPCQSQFMNAVQITLEQIDIIRRFTEMYKDTLTFATSSSDIRKIHRSDASTRKIASLIGVLGGPSLGNSMAVLRSYYELGVRYLTLNHLCNTPWAEAERREDLREDPVQVDGLTHFGKLIVQEMNRLGMIVDVSGASEKTMHDVFDASTAPVIMSHSASKAVCDNPRNVGDQTLKALRDNGGIVMVPFYSRFVACQEKSTLSDVVAHINHIRSIIGTDHIGIGSYFDSGDSTPVGLEDVSKFPNLFEELWRQNWSEEDLKKLAGENFLRVFRKVEEESRNLQGTPVSEAQAPSEDVSIISLMANVTEVDPPNGSQPRFTRTRFLLQFISEVTRKHLVPSRYLFMRMVEDPN
ncbi:unnamed protein product [Cyprideis torosa]|uniref:Dipeptidase n=1 Tax=Cyprideis torosa TaxID=163714 RepID=A0A7R8W199_9CRUS|nr:unnamed protein product [Cyprideis torosa]CAG0880683.1 unnamed protein product [Cyprideis torosa]